MRLFKDFFPKHSVTVTMSNGKVKKWRKVLYDNHGYPDNFTPDECFLAARRFNENQVLYSLSQCLNGGAEVGVHISLVIIFWCCYNFIKMGSISSSQMSMAVLSVSVLGHMFLALKNSSNFLANLYQTLKTSFLFIMTGYSLSPVLYTLTDTISTDSIHSMAATSFLLHLLTNDYGVPAPVVSWQISLNAAVFSSVCLASRFDDHMSAFALLCLSVFCFLLVPLSRPHLMTSSLTCSLLSSSTCLLLLSYISLSHTLLATFSLLTVQILCPILFFYLQADKLTIHGPWDEATPENH